MYSESNSENSLINFCSLASAMCYIKAIGTKMIKKGPGVLIFYVATISMLLNCQILLNYTVSSGFRGTCRCLVILSFDRLG